MSNDFLQNFLCTRAVCVLLLLAVKKRNLKETIVLLNEIINDADISLGVLWYLMSLDIANSKILQPLSLVKEKHHLKISAQFLIYLVFSMINWLKQFFQTHLLILTLPLWSIF